jgi:phosphoribosylanthranilate isomerase
VTWVKICGTTCLEDALLAVRAGADALGFIFAESPRQIEPAQAAEIIAQLPDRVEKVGVFVNPSLAYVERVARQTGITRAQLYGNEEVELLSQAAEASLGLRVTKVVLAQRLPEYLAGLAELDVPWVADSLLVDSGSREQPGGTGKVFNWQAASEAISESEWNEKLRWIIAGGLTPENVGDAIRLFHPWGVDVASGVESRPGSKDADKLKRFIAAVRSAEEKKS